MRIALALFLAIVVFGAAEPGDAQVISPGKLSTPHASLEGVRNCTQCHELRQRGSSARLCLSCHEPLRDRIAKGTGFHATVAQRSCAECHKEHLGRDFDVTRLDSVRFAHEKTGYPLNGKHVEVGCRNCHAPKHIAAADVRAHQGGSTFLAKTFLGLARNCTSCHTSDSPHDRQFAGQECSSCHDERDWKSVPRFSHARASFKLTGAHATTECSGCHKAEEEGSLVRWVGVAFNTCTDCHKDPHASRMGGSCTRCHSTNAWGRLTADLSSNFEHARTGYTLRGAHVRVECGKCHAQPRVASTITLRFVAGTERASYPRPVVKDCGSCHVDPHPRAVAMASTQSCAGCHSESSWTPTRYGPEKHGRTFPLEGAHLVTPCLSCHRESTSGTQSKFVLPAARTCSACHKRNDPHEGRFGTRPCEECHTTAEWKKTSFDHKRVNSEKCSTCHARQDPHNAQFAGVNCAVCHTTMSFRIAQFDHTLTRYRLDGAHVKVSCGYCHKSEQDSQGKSFVRYRPLDSSCRSCHRSGP